METRFLGWVTFLDDVNYFGAKIALSETKNWCGRDETIQGPISGGGLLPDVGTKPARPFP